MLALTLSPKVDRPVYQVFDDCHRLLPQTDPNSSNCRPSRFPARLVPTIPRHSLSDNL